MGAASHLALARLTSRPLIGGTRKHLIFGGDPSQPGSLTPTRDPLSDRGITQHSGATKAHQHRTLSLRQPAAFDPDVSQLVQAASVNSRSLTHLAKGSGPHRHSSYDNTVAQEFSFEQPRDHRGSAHQHAPTAHRGRIPPSAVVPVSRNAQHSP